jgi:uncharacterized protein (DUF2236 family)
VRLGSREYLRDRLASPEICVTAPARDVAAVILEAPLPAPLRLLAPVHRLAIAALLPLRLREEYGLGWSRAHAMRLTIAAPSLRVLAVPLFRLAGRVSSSPSLGYHASRARDSVSHAPGSRATRAA